LKLGYHFASSNKCSECSDYERDLCQDFFIELPWKHNWKKGWKKDDWKIWGSPWQQTCEISYDEPELQMPKPEPKISIIPSPTDMLFQQLSQSWGATISEPSKVKKPRKPKMKPVLPIFSPKTPLTGEMPRKLFL